MTDINFDTSDPIETEIAPENLNSENDADMSEAKPSDSEGGLDLGEKQVDSSESINKLSDRIASLEKLFESKILNSENEGKIIDRMHKELQLHKEDMYSKLTRPILLDVITLRDNVINVLKAYQERIEDVPLATVEMTADEAQALLEKHGIEVVKSEEGSDFVPVTQKAVKKIITGDKSLHGKVAKSITDGYSLNGKVISPEKVTVYFYQQQP